MAGKFVRRLLSRNQLTLPMAVVRKLGLAEGDHLQISVGPEGRIEVRRAVLVTEGTAAAAREDARAEDDIKRGRYVAFDDAADAVRYLENRATPPGRMTGAVLTREREHVAIQRRTAVAGQARGTARSGRRRMQRTRGS